MKILIDNQLIIQFTQWIISVQQGRQSQYIKKQKTKKKPNKIQKQNPPIKTRKKQKERAYTIVPLHQTFFCLVPTPATTF